jgi:hypothetical protein
LTGAGPTTIEATTTGQQLFAWNGSAWVNAQAATAMPDPDIWGVGDSLWLLDGTGGFYELVNGVKTTRAGLPGLHEIWGLSSTSFLGATDTHIYVSNGTSGWTLLPGFGGSSDIKDLWASPTGTTILLPTAVDLNYFWGGSWHSFDYGGQEITGAWGCDADHAWVISALGKVFYFENGFIHTDGNFGFSPTRLNAVSGTSCTDVWVVGDAGAAFHWDGTSWTDKSVLGGPYFSSITVRGPGQVLAAGDGGTGGLLSVVGGFLNGDIPTQSDDVTSLWRLDNGQVYAAGQNLLLRGLR